jgi:hypothetical protein
MSGSVSGLTHDWDLSLNWCRPTFRLSQRLRRSPALPGVLERSRRSPQNLRDLRFSVVSRSLCVLLRRGSHLRLLLEEMAHEIADRMLTRRQNASEAGAVRAPSI